MKRKRKRILKKVFDTRPLQSDDPLGMARPGYTGRDLSLRIESVGVEARKLGYDAWELKWWDFCEGWAYARGDIK